MGPGFPRPRRDAELPAETAYCWIRDGVEFKQRLLDVLGKAARSIRLETYIFTDDDMGRAVRAALVAAAQRGVRVRVLVDAIGSIGLPSGFWEPLTAAGGEARIFNPITVRHLPIRNHRKLVVVDDEEGGVGGFNVADEYSGDGVTTGWADLGLGLRGPAVAALARTFDRLFDDVRDPKLPALVARVRRGLRPPPEQAAPDVQLLSSGPGRRANAFQQLLRADVAGARDVRFVSAYFLPTYSLRRLLRVTARRGGRVQVLVPGRTDVPLSQRAARTLYGSLMRAGVELWEYQPQILHAKLFLADDAVYVGSSNLDTRSLHINFELMLRVTRPGTVAEAHVIFDDLLARSRRVDPASWSRSRTWLQTLRERWAFWLLSRVDPYVTRWMVRAPR